MFAQETGEVFVLLVTIAHADMPAPIRVCNAGATVTSGGQDFVHFPFEIDLPRESEDAPPTVTLRICNVDRQIVEAVRTYAGEITVTVNLVLASSPDTVEAGPFEFTMREAHYDALVVEGTLAFQDVLNEPYPADSFTPSRFPGLFG